MKKKVLSMALALSMVVALTACGGNSGGNNAATSSSSSGEATSTEDAAAENPVEVGIAYEMAVGEPGDTGVNKVKDTLEASGLGFTVKTYPAGALGKKDDVIDQILSGQNYITVADPLYLGKDELVGDLSVLYGPMLFKDMDQALNYMRNSEWLKEKNEELASKGLRIIGFDWIYGERVVTTKSEVTKPEDLKGMKLRVNSNDLQIETFKALGTAPTAMALTEVFGAIEAGTVDGFENTYSTMYNQGFYEVCPYIYNAPIVCAVSLWICGEEFFQSLTAEQQTALLDAMKAGAEANNKQMNEESAGYLQSMVDAGSKVYDLSDDELAELTDILSSVYTNEAVTKHWSDPDLYSKIKAEIDSLK